MRGPRGRGPRGLHRLLLGLAGLIGLLAGGVGVPAVLLAIDAPLLPGGSVTGLWKALGSPDDGSVAMSLIGVVAWLAWAVFAVSLVVELAAGARGVRVSVPGLGGPQAAVRGLLGLALLLLPVGAVGVTASSAPAGSGDAPGTAAGPAVHHRTESGASLAEQIDDSAPAAGADPSEAERAGPADAAVRTYTVRTGDSLWSIAQAELGDARRYVELIRLNADLLRGNPDHIEPGWQLRLPWAPDTSIRSLADHPEGESGVEQGRAGTSRRDLLPPGHERGHPPDHRRTPEPRPLTSETTGVAAQRTAGQPTAPSARHGVTDAARTEPPSVAATRMTAQTDRSAIVGEGSDIREAHVVADSPDWALRTSFGVGALLSAGVVGLLAGHRARRSRSRGFGVWHDPVAADAGHTETQLRAVADEVSVDHVDLALRQLAQRVAESAVPPAAASMPPLRAVRLTADELEVYLDGPADLPGWVGTPDRQLWTLPTAELAELDPGLRASVPAPYPALVGAGQDLEGGHVLIDLEHIGLFGITGPADTAAAVFAGMAVQLATSRWADTAHVVIVGAHAGLEDSLRTGRIRHRSTLAAAIDEVATRVAGDRQAFGLAGVASVAQARSASVAADAWSPDVLFVAQPPTAAELDRLRELATVGTAVGVVVLGASVGDWELDVRPETVAAAEGLEPGQVPAGVGRLGPVGLPVRYQALPAAQLGHVAEIARSLLEPMPPEPTEPSLPMARVVDARIVELARQLKAAQVDTVGRPVARSADSGCEPCPAAGAEKTDPRPPERGTQRVRLRLLGDVRLDHAPGPVDPIAQRLLLEVAACVAAHPGAQERTIAAALRPNDDPATAVHRTRALLTHLRTWLGAGADGEPVLIWSRERVGFGDGLGCDLSEWIDIVGCGPVTSLSTGDLDTALSLVSGPPLGHHHPRTYAWASPLIERLGAEITDVAYELGRRYLAAGRWDAVARPVQIGLSVEPGQERLWRLRITAARAAGRAEATDAAVTGLLDVTEQLEVDLEPATEDLLAYLVDPEATLAQVLATTI